MDKQESLQRLQHKFGKLFNNIKKIPKQLADAVEEGLKEGLSETSNLVCVQDGVLNYDLIEEDVKQIHKNLKARGNRIPRSHLILDNEADLMEIRTYTERDDKTFVTIVGAEVKRVTNIPPEVLTELQQNGRVELKLSLKP